MHFSCIKKTVNCPSAHFSWNNIRLRSYVYVFSLSNCLQFYLILWNLQTLSVEWKISHKCCCFFSFISETDSQSNYSPVDNNTDLNLFIRYRFAVSCTAVIKQTITWDGASITYIKHKTHAIPCSIPISWPIMQALETTKTWTERNLFVLYFIIHNLHQL